MVLCLVANGSITAVLTLRYVQGDLPSLSFSKIIFIGSMALYGSMLLFIWAMSLSREDRQQMLKRAPSRSRSHPLFALVPFLLSIPVNLLYSQLIMKFFPAFYQRMEAAGNMPENILLDKDPLSLLLIVLSVVVIAPIVEELMFRGILYNLLNQSMGVLPAMLVSSLIFGLMHGPTFFQTAVIGISIAFIYQVTGNLKLAMVAHAVNNGLALLVALLNQKGILESNNAMNLMLIGITVALAVWMFFATIRYLRHHKLSTIFNDVTPMYKEAVLRQQDEMRQQREQGF